MADLGDVIRESLTRYPDRPIYAKNRLTGELDFVVLSPTSWKLLVDSKVIALHRTEGEDEFLGNY